MVRGTPTGGTGGLVRTQIVWSNGAFLTALDNATSVPDRRLVGGYRLGVPAAGRVESLPDVNARSDLGVEPIGWGRSSGMGSTSHSRRPRWIVGSILITLAGAVGIVIGLIVGSAVVVGLSGGLAGILLSLVVFGRLLGTE